MKLRIAVAAAALSIAGGAIAAGNQSATSTGSPSGDHATTSSQQQSSQSTGNMSSEQSNPTLVRSAQQALKQKGYDVGTIDGQLGPTTESALRNFQQQQGLPQSGNLDQPTLSALGVEQQGASMPGPGSTGSSQGSQNSPSSTTSQGSMQDQGSSSSTPQSSSSNSPSSGSYK
jgi:peptidoglycan hydrolase-like protein with peptidoglycan-binding domain